MKVASSTIAYASTHVLGMQEDEQTFSNTGSSISEEHSSHSLFERDADYEVQLHGRAGTTPAAVPDTGGKGATDAVHLDLSKLSPEEQANVNTLETYLHLRQAASGTPTVTTSNVSAGLSQQAHWRAETTQSVKTSQTVTPTADDARWRQVGTFHETASHSRVGENEMVIGSYDTAGLGAKVQRLAETAGSPGLVDFLGESAVYTPFRSSDGRESGVRSRETASNRQQRTEQEYVAWSAAGSVETADGKKINIDTTALRLRTAESSHSDTTAAIDDPLVIQYGKGSVGLTEQKYRFDLNADGQADSISFVKPGAGFLALDKNGDGKINDGSELFGVKSGNGFTDLAAYDADHNGWIDESDDIYSKLRIWSKDDQGHDQLLSLKEAGVGAVYLGSVDTKFSLKDSDNNTLGQITQSGLFLREDGSSGTVQNVNLVRGAASEVNDAPAPVRQGSADAWTAERSSSNVDISLDKATTVSVEKTDAGYILRNNRATPLQIIGLLSVQAEQQNYAETGHFSSGTISSELGTSSSEATYALKFSASSERTQAWSFGFMAYPTTEPVQHKGDSLRSFQLAFSQQESVSQSFEFSVSSTTQALKTNSKLDQLSTLLDEQEQADTGAKTPVQKNKHAQEMYERQKKAHSHYNQLLSQLHFSR